MSTESTENNQLNKQESLKKQNGPESSPPSNTGYTNLMLTIIAICLSILTYKSFMPVDVYVDNAVDVVLGGGYGSLDVNVTNPVREVKIKQGYLETFDVNVTTPVEIKQGSFDSLDVYVTNGELDVNVTNRQLAVCDLCQ